MTLTDCEWKVLEALWQGEGQTLGQVLNQLAPETGWSRTTVHTYLTRMTAKNLVCHDDSSPKRYSAKLSCEQAASQERTGLMARFYQGSPTNLVASFVQDGTLSKQEIMELRRLLDQMEV